MQNPGDAGRGGPHAVMKGKRPSQHGRTKYALYCRFCIDNEGCPTAATARTMPPSTEVVYNLTVQPHPSPASHRDPMPKTNADGEHSLDLASLTPRHTDCSLSIHPGHPLISLSFVDLCHSLCAVVLSETAVVAGRRSQRTVFPMSLDVAKASNKWVRPLPRTEPE